MEKKLTYKQAAFCREYVSNKGNGAQAYLKAYDTKDYSTATTEASLLLKEPHIQAEIVRLTKPDSDKQKSERDRIKELLWNIAEDNAEKTENRCRAVDILNRMNAEYIQRTENTTESTVKLDREALDSLLNA